LCPQLEQEKEKREQKADLPLDQGETWRILGQDQRKILRVSSFQSVAEPVAIVVVVVVVARGGSERLSSVVRGLKLPAVKEFWETQTACQQEQGQGLK
jgi:hypothetical protein